MWISYLQHRSGNAATSLRRQRTFTFSGTIGWITMMVAGRIEPPFPSALLAGVAGPTLIMIGSADAVVDRTHLPALAAAMPGCALKVIPSAKHELLFEAAVHRDQAVGAMLAFLADSGNDRQRNSGSWGGIARGVKHAEPDVACSFQSFRSTMTPSD